jgi:hypothetical protein
VILYRALQLAYFAFVAWLLWMVRGHPAVCVMLAAAATFAYLLPAA